MNPEQFRIEGDREHFQHGSRLYGAIALVVVGDLTRISRSFSRVSLVFDRLASSGLPVQYVDRGPDPWGKASCA